MFWQNGLPQHRQPLDPADADLLGLAAADEVERFLRARDGAAPTPLHALLELVRKEQSIYSTTRPLPS